MDAHVQYLAGLESDATYARYVAAESEGGSSVDRLVRTSYTRIELGRLRDL